MPLGGENRGPDLFKGKRPKRPVFLNFRPLACAEFHRKRDTISTLYAFYAVFPDVYDDNRQTLCNQ